MVYLTVLMMFLLKLNISIMKIFLSDSGGERQQVEGGSHCEYVMRPRGPLIPTTDVLECWHSHDLSFQHKLLHMSVLNLWVLITDHFKVYDSAHSLSDNSTKQYNFKGKIYLGIFLKTLGKF